MTGWTYDDYAAANTEPGDGQGPKRLKVQVLELLDASFQADARGDRDESHHLIDQAGELEPLLVVAIVGGIRIGEIPNPETDPDGWAEYVQAQRDGLT